jgi:hypothetical protein
MSSSRLTSSWTGIGSSQSSWLKSIRRSAVGLSSLRIPILSPHCFPDFFYYIPLVPGVDVCCCLRGAVSQVLPLVSWESQLVCTVRDKNSESCTAGHLESHHSTDVLVKDSVGTHVLPTTSRGLT